MPRHVIPPLALVALLLCAPTAARCAPEPDSLAPVQSGSLVLTDTAASGSVPSQPGRSPGLALLFSAVVPGAGQIYTGSYWKVPVILGFGTYFTSQWLHYNRLTSEARDRYTASLLVDPAGDRVQLSLREFYKDQRDAYTWYLAILYLLNLADAYVDASLYDFDVGEDLSVRLMPDERGRMTLRVGF
jgi:hypothetical protein